ncbi:hypothetical protein IMG5_054760 [Ichthyophthirius multifiliis]|uniref:Transmembrane protein n=1 Tax=Ichthyophthirius multifiliis TaxID=5932 RepID=G0QN23_ICHMU|nr:hypothetical protein IMG5_054760 [Ichthyophthirius multifiliis]EGR33386.1 hypothetical protein IMG5_054760 [Ichthyophthirius multifiliis]|eukprot:XP_004037372.1 hypothetical protein IMG5_054760 [Ichthyophthirius multifiliis]
MIKISSLLKEVDLFSRPIGLHMNNSFYFKTSFGGFMSLIVIILVLLFFNASIKSFINKEEVYVKVDKQYNPNPFKSIINTNRFMFFTAITQPDFLEKPLFNITVYQKTYIWEGSKQIRQNRIINLEPCQDYHFENLNQELNFTNIFHQYGKNYLCPTLESQMQLEGMFSSPVFSFLEVTVSKCITPNDSNSKWNPKCQSIEEYNIQTNNKDGFFGIVFYHNNYVLNSDQPQGYFTNFLNDKMYYTFVPDKMTKIADIYFQDIEVRTDHSLIPIKDVEQRFFLVQENNDVREASELGRSDGKYVVLTLRKSPYITIIQRNYKKISQLMSELGGFVQIVFTAVAILMVKYNNINFVLELANKLYSFEIKNRKLKIKISYIQSIFQRNLNIKKMQINLSNQKKQIKNNSQQINLINYCLKNKRQNSEQGTIFQFQHVEKYIIHIEIYILKKLHII